MTLNTFIMCVKSSPPSVSRTFSSSQTDTLYVLNCKSPCRPPQPLGTTMPHSVPIIFTILCPHKSGIRQYLSFLCGLFHLTYFFQGLAML